MPFSIEIENNGTDVETEGLLAIGSDPYINLDAYQFKTDGTIDPKSKFFSRNGEDIKYCRYKLADDALADEIFKELAEMEQPQS